jgi:osmotically-inducible protein OsmY
MATKTRRKEVETVRTYRSEDIPLTDSEPTGWSRFLPGSRARARNRYAARLREALARIEAPDLPEIDASDISIPEVRLPEAKLRDLKLRERLQGVRLPDVNVPDVKVRDIKAPEIKLPDVNLSDIKLPEVTMRDVRDAAEWPRRAWQRRQRAQRAATWTGRGIGAGTVLLAGLAGAAAAYFLDPDRGRGRRIQAADQLGAFARRTGDDVGRVARYVSATASAKAQAWMRPRSDYMAPNDAALKAKVESELFADPSIDKGRLNINVESGVVVLRGTADSEDQIARIVSATRAISGVRNVRDVLRVPSQAMTGVVASPESTSNGWTATDGETSEYGSDQPA